MKKYSLIKHGNSTNKLIALFVLNCLLSLGMKAQPPRTITMIALADADVKGFSVETVPNSNDEAVMTGTGYGMGNGDNEILFYRALVGSSTSLVNHWRYEDLDYIDQRGIDIAAAGPNDFFITALSRSDGSGSASARDRIRILETDVTGAVTDEVIISSADYNLYPLHSLYHSSNGNLYICGYMTPNSDNTELPNEPDFTTDNNAFIIKYDPGSHTATGRLHNTGTYWKGIGTFAEDFDIAMRMTEITDGFNVGNIHVTGSVNVLRDGNGVGVQHTSGTMNLLIDQNLGLISAPHFASGNGDQYSNDEYGVGFIEEQMFARAFVVGNIFSRGSTQFLNGFDVEPQLFWLTGVQTTNQNSPGIPCNIYAGNSRWQVNGFDYAWALEVLPSSNRTTGSSFPMVIAGMATGEWCNNGSSSYDNITPFLFDAEWFLNTSTGQIGDPFSSPGLYARWASYRNQTGTGRKNLDFNSYWDLGGSLSNVAWNPTFVGGTATGIMSNPGDSLFFAAPKMRDSTSFRPVDPGLLNFKMIRAIGWANGNGDALDEPLCPGSVDILDQTDLLSCNAGTGGTVVGPIGYTTITTPMFDSTNPAEWNTFNLAVDDVSSRKTDFSVWTDTCETSTPSIVYKSTGVSSLKTEQYKVFIFPNPAKEELMVLLGNTVTDADIVKLELYSIQGQHVSTLYEGNAAAMRVQKSFSLRTVATGAYLVHLSVNGINISRQKMIITD